jgi:hypothetical protein
VCSGSGDLEEIEAHLDWLDGDQAKVDAYFDRRRAARAEATWCAFCHELTEATERYWLGSEGYEFWVHERCRVPYDQACQRAEREWHLT